MRILQSTFAIIVVASCGPAVAEPFKGLALERAYLTCEVNEQAGRYTHLSLAQCSVIYETLKREVFNGSFTALRAWYEAEQAEGYPTLYGGNRVAHGGA
ncbi:MAG: hypothetical protein AAFN59_04110 [Pseudomonadota bacterium]